ncbi:cleavage stimulation factor subunit 2 tau variant-like isoform X2 [Leptotrombidium deliense]|uniref:Cleavage stimulation factor subunit 2 tau variant-like isoform X2 n=1 Tax=Leptotrombidium deliense TaxID=299467 RepID=A0A443SMC9_9ACAR|nr:cleavage stimulation factor subunit 2 tau variant-like isoform X2 [Leptotrombidium deliense]
MSNILSATDRSLKSVFVGNIPYDATEEKLKDIFSEVGPVISFRLVYDRETGKPKGYGFCEYKDQETALSAMRNLNGYELNGRTLRVDNAANERTREEIRNLQSSLVGSFESPYGPEVDPEKAPEVISKAVASLPPEQMFELAKTMKECIQTNPNEARNMLIQNPQLAYALLQALVVMRIVDPQIALSILHRPNVVQPLVPQESIPQPQPWVQDTFNRPIPPQQILPTPSTSVPVAPAPFDPRSMNRLREQPSVNIDPRIRPQPAFDPRISQVQPNMMRPPIQGIPMPHRPPREPQPQISSQDQEKAQLIMQVLQLSDQQIQMLPKEQRESIILLKQQITGGTVPQ